MQIQAMQTQTTMSAKGQVVIPKEIRDRLGFVVGARLDVVETGGGVLLALAKPRSGRSFEEIEADLRRLIRHDGPAASVEEMDETIRRMTGRSAIRGDRARG